MKKPTSLPGRPSRSSRSGRPIMAALDLLGRRWSLRVVWELRAQPHTFRALQAASDDLSPTVLSARLGELREARVVELRDNGYALTALGTELLTALAPLQAWSQRWADELAPSRKPRRRAK